MLIDTRCHLDVVAGLDRARRLRLFEAQFAVTRAAGLPVILHVRKAHDAALATLARVRGGIAHAYNGALEQARRYAAPGLRPGFGGVITFPRSRKLRALAQALPDTALGLETDAPDLTPMLHRRARNSPEYLPECLAAPAAARAEALAPLTTANACAAPGLQVLSCPAPAGCAIPVPA